MRLRHRLLLLFAGFALVPLIAMGVFDYARSLRHLEAVLAVQTQGIADRAAQELKDRLNLQESDVGLLSENAEVQRLLHVAHGRDLAATSAARGDAERYLQELWRTMRFGYERVAISDTSGRVLLALSAVPDPIPIRSAHVLAQVREIRALGSTRSLGRLEFTPSVGDLFRSPVFRSAFGAAGRTLVVDRVGRRVIAEPSAGPFAPPDTAYGFDRFTAPRGSFAYRRGTEQRVASFVSFEQPQWTLLVTASLDEFADPFVRLRLLDLSVLLAVIIAVSLGFYLLLRRATASLDSITLAADRVGRGDFDPILPPAGPDEVGKLSAAFALMTSRIKEMIAQVEASRQMGVLGRFAAELAHEIRNPLTAIKINLQGLARDAKAGRVPEESRRSIEMALREIRRLDLAVKTALRTGKPPAEPRPLRYQPLLSEAVDLVGAQAAEHAVALHSDFAAIEDRYFGDPEALRAVFVNVLLNAIEAMPEGGSVWVSARDVHAADEPAIEISFRDDGPGIPFEIRDRVFRPFFTTKAEGTGLGLSLATQTIRAHGGTLTLGVPERGTEVVIALPVRPEPVIS